MERKRRDSVIFVGLLCLITLTHSATVKRDIAVGVILDLDSPLGDMARTCINIALNDSHTSTTNLTPLFRDSGNDILTAADVARDLINKEKVQAILGPQNSEEARFVVELGNKFDVPVIWFSPSGPSLLPPRSRFFIHSNTTTGLCLQFKAIAAIIQAYGWQCVVPIYEEPEFGNDLIPCLTYALQEMDTQVPYTSAIRQGFSDDDFKKELDEIKDRRTCVFLAHMTVELWSKFVEHAQKEGIMDKGYAWILTQALSSVIDPEAKDIKLKGYMDGVLGMRPSFVSTPSHAVYNFIRRKRRSLAAKLWYEYNKTLSLYCMWAYDTITALANAVEKANLVNSNESTVDLREAIKDTDFIGASGNFSLRQGQLEPSRILVYNVKDQRDKIIGNWSAKTGLYQNHSVVVEWPGKAEETPPRLKIGVPNAHFTEFVNVSGEGDENVSATGFAVDVFNKVIHALPFNLTYDFVHVNNNFGDPTLSSYELLLRDMKDKKVDVDVLIGDITIVVNRTKYVDFTMPYLDSSVSMVVKVMSDDKNGWILLKPFHWSLWLTLGLIFVGATVIVMILECKRKNGHFDNFRRNPFLIYMSDVLSLESGTSKWVVILVMFVLGVAVQIYTANLTSILSERTTAKPPQWKDVQEIKRNNVTVGYQNGSWVKNFLINQIGLKGAQLMALKNREDYKEKLSNGTEKGGVDAIFDETPYLRLFLSDCNSCKMTGPIYKTGGFAFAFPKNSTLVSNFSAAILKVTQNVMMFNDMKKSISLPVTIDKSEYKSDVETRSLTKDDFGGLFPIVYSVLALFFAISILKTEWLQKKWASCRTA